MYYIYESPRKARNTRKCVFVLVCLNKTYRVKGKLGSNPDDHEMRLAVATGITAFCFICMINVNIIN